MMACGRLIGLILIVAPLPLSGCGISTVAKQAFHEVRGAQAKVRPVRDIASDLLARYQSLRFEPVTATVGEQMCPMQLRRAWDDDAAALTLELSQGGFPGGPPLLAISSEILYFQQKGMLSGAECIARVKMHEDSELVADMIVRAESKAFRAGGEEALAGACIKTLGKFLKEQKGEVPEDRESEEDRRRPRGD
ncbi:MAG: hypothetical protein KKB50_11890 [Planctomycetes bacterium]|nr:hypothetical protein [Planctomycetota bacterium]